MGACCIGRQRLAEGCKGLILFTWRSRNVGPLAIPRSLIQRLDLSRGVPSLGANALRQGAISAVLWGLTLVLVNEMDDTPRSAGEAALIGGVIGFATGAILGAIFPRERWKSARLSSP